MVEPKDPKDQEPEDKPQLPPSRMREAVDKRGKTSGPTVARRQGKEILRKKGKK